MIRKPELPEVLWTSDTRLDSICSRDRFLEKKHTMFRFERDMKRCNKAEVEPAYEKIMGISYLGEK